MDAATRWVSTLGGSKGTDAERPGKSTCRSVWQDELGVFEVLQIRGDALRSMGSSLEGNMILHAEEGAWLAERRMLAVFPPSSQQSPAGARVSTSSEACFLPAGVLYDLLTRAGVPWECYRAYAELKRRSYVVRRRPVDTVGRANDAPRAPKLSIFRPEAEVAVSSDEALPVAFHLYAPNSNFRKRDPGPPDAAVVVCRYNDSMPAHEALVRLGSDLAEMSAGMSRAGRDQGLQVEEASGSGREAAGAREELKRRPGIMLAVVCLDGAVHLFDVGLADPDMRPVRKQGSEQQQALERG